MKTKAFRSWLLNVYRKADGGSLNDRTVRSRVSNCSTVEHYKGDLEFDRDQLRGLLDCLTYSKEDERRNRPTRHGIPIVGIDYTGTATLKQAVSLYKQFREYPVNGTLIRPATANRDGIPAISRVSNGREPRAWPTWGQPGPAATLALAHLTVPFVRFLNPNVVQKIVQDNELHRTEWCNALRARRIVPEIYLWHKSPCAFPGVRRHAGGQEIAAFRGHARPGENQNLKDYLAVDDNDYPKHLWSFVFRGDRFRKRGPENYSLAHLADHKVHGNRFEEDFELADCEMVAQPLFGLYTCPSNTVYTPRSLIKPTDFDGTIRALLVRKAQELYEPFCNLLPPYLRIRKACSPKWEVREFTWAQPVGDLKHIAIFLEFRSDQMAKLINGSGDK